MTGLRRSDSGRLWVPEAPHLITRPHRRIGITAPMTRVAGYFTWELVHARTRDVVRRVGPYRNLITDAGLDILQATTFTGATVWCRVGTGSNAPVVGDTALQTPLDSTNSDGGFADVTGEVGGAYWRLSRTRVFTTAQANGNLTELGFSAGAATNLLTRQLFLDELGAPTTVVKTNEFDLRIIYELRLLFDNTDEVQSVLINTVATNVTRRRASQWADSFDALADADSVTGAFVRGPAASLAAAGSDPTGGSAVNCSTIGAQAYTPGNFFRDYITLWGASVANGVNYNVIVLSCFGNAGQQKRWAYDLGTNIIKNNTQRFAIEHTILWGREIIS